MHAPEHRPLCTIALVAEGHAERCPGETCAFWAEGCVLERVEADLQGHPDVAALLLNLRRTVEAGEPVPVAAAREHLLAALGDAGSRAGPASGATELV